MIGTCALHALYYTQKMHVYEEVDFVEWWRKTQFYCRLSSSQTWPCNPHVHVYRISYANNFYKFIFYNLHADLS